MNVKAWEYLVIFSGLLHSSVAYVTASFFQNKRYATLPAYREPRLQRRRHRTRANQIIVRTLCLYETFKVLIRQ